MTARGYTNEEIFDGAQEVLEGIRDAQLSDIAAEIGILIKKHRPFTSNEVLAEIAADAWVDACDGWGLDCREQDFAAHFPTLAFYARGF